MGGAKKLEGAQDCQRRTVIERSPAGVSQLDTILSFSSANVILILGGHVICDLMNHFFVLPYEFPPDTARRGLTCRVRWNPDQTKSSVEFLGIGLWPPPIGPC